MRDAKLIRTMSEVPVSEVKEVNRLRPTSDAGVESLIASITALGVMKDPIQVRKAKHKDGALVLIAGAHRLEAARRLGWDMIPAKVWDCADDWARMMEIDDNLSGAEMDTLDLCVFLAERKRVYEKLYPETRRGVAGASARWDATDTMSVASSSQTDTMSFCQNVAEQRDLSERQIRRLVSAGEALAPEAVTKLRTAPNRVQLKDLMVIAKCDPSQRNGIVTALHSGKAKSAKAALDAKAAPGPARTDADGKYLKLLDAWDRAPIAVRRQFLEARAAQIAEHGEVAA